MSKPVAMLVTYRPVEGKEEELLRLLESHWPALERVGLVTDRPAQIWKATDKRSGRSYFVEMFEWKDENASDVAHQTPEVMAIWEPMGPILEDLQLAQVEAVAAQGG